MERLRDLNPARWVLDDPCNRHEPCAHRPERLRVQDFLPGSYDCYLKVLNPVWEHPEHDRGGVWVGADGEWDDRFGNPPRGARRVSWSAAASLVGRAFSPAFTISLWNGDVRRKRWPPSWAWPDEDALDEASFSALLRVLSPVPEPLFAYYDLVPAFHDLSEDPPAEVLLCGDAAELAAFVAATPRRTTPTFWWPESRAWLVSTPYDHTFSLLGGTLALLARVAAEPDVESLWCDAQTVVWQGPVR